MTVRRLIILASALLCACVVVVAGCDSTESATETPGLYPVCVDGKWGYIDNTGVVKIDPQFDSAYDFSEGLARVVVTENGDTKQGYIDTSGTMVIEPQFEWVEDFSEGMAAVAAGFDENGGSGQWGYIDKTGTVVIPMQYAQARDFSGGIAGVVDETGADSGSPSYIDKTGKVIWQGE